MAGTGSDRGSDEASPSSTVYLDQFAWVQLARARLGRPNSPDHSTARENFVQAKLAGHVAFPLSMAHYLETWHQASEQRRGELSVEMALLSGFITVAPAATLWRHEMDWALHRQFGRPVAPE